MKRALLKSGGTAVLAALASPAFAHVGAGHIDGFAAGLVHPLTGVDHLLAMVAVGVWAALAMPRRVWAAPAVFLATMVAGALLAFVGVGLPAVEGMIALSVLVLGMMVVGGTGLSPVMGVALAGVFALFHGHAHASEASGTAIAYVAGFALSTAVLHLAGVGLGLRLATSAWVRAAIGIAIASSGAAFVFGG